MEFREKAFFLDENVSKFNLGELDCIYIGDEFCERLLPSLNELENAINLCVLNKLKLTIVTAYSSDEGISKLINCLDFISQKKVECEIVVNDWGVLGMLRELYPGLKLILGRILVSQYLSASNSKLAENNSSIKRKKINFYSNFPDIFLNFLKENNISCLEFNSYSHLINTREQLRNFGFFCHIYYPFKYLTTSRYCGYVKSAHFYMHSATQCCYKACGKYVAIKKSMLIEENVFIKGNTHFIKETKDLSQLTCTVDRIIYNDFLGV